MAAADVAGKNQFCGFAVFFNKQFQDSRTQNMAGILKFYLDARRRAEDIIITLVLTSGDRFGIF